MKITNSCTVREAARLPLILLPASMIAFACALVSPSVSLATGTQGTTDSNSCYGEGEDRVHRYAHVQVTTFLPAGGDTETVVSFSSR